MSDPELNQVSEEEKPVTPLRCFTGASISGVLAIAASKLMISMAQTYATKPINFTNPIAVNIASAVRTLVVGITALATGIFTMVTLGLCALAIKLIFHKKTTINN
jgi:hypothetical protein